jgi:uncharacterized protein (DUF433 family)
MSQGLIASDPKITPHLTAESIRAAIGFAAKYLERM